MKIFYLLLVHQAPEQLKRQITQLQGEEVFFLIHIDAKADASAFHTTIQDDNVHWIENRVNCIWGDFSQVQATLNLLAAVEQFNPQPNDRIVLKSGQDYPLHSAQNIRHFFEQHPNEEFIECFIAADIHPRPYRNFRGYKVNYSDKRGDYVLFKKHNFTGFYKALCKGKIPKEAWHYFWNQKELPDVTTFYKGSQWWALTYGTWQKMAQYYQAHLPTWKPFFTTAFCADEYFFQTLLQQQCKSETPIQIKPTVTYVEWNRPNVPLPVQFTIEDAALLDKQRKNNFLYARKFEAGSPLLSIIDQWIATEGTLE